MIRRTDILWALLTGLILFFGTATVPATTPDMPGTSPTPATASTPASAPAQNWLSAPFLPSDPPPAAHLHVRLRNTGVIFLGTGLAAAATGIPLIHLNGKCATSPPSTAESCELHHYTGPAGIALLVSGIAVSITGAMLLGIRTRRMRHARKVP